MKGTSSDSIYVRCSTDMFLMLEVMASTVSLDRTVTLLFMGSFNPTTSLHDSTFAPIGLSGRGGTSQLEGAGVAVEGLPGLVAAVSLPRGSQWPSGRGLRYRSRASCTNRPVMPPLLPSSLPFPPRRGRPSPLPLHERSISLASFQTLPSAPSRMSW